MAAPLQHTARSALRTGSSAVECIHAGKTGRHKTFNQLRMPTFHQGACLHARPPQVANLSAVPSKTSRQRTNCCQCSNKDIISRTSTSKKPSEQLWWLSPITAVAFGLAASNAVIGWNAGDNAAFNSSVSLPALSYTAIGATVVLGAYGCYVLVAVLLKSVVDPAVAAGSISQGHLYIERKPAKATAVNGTSAANATNPCIATGTSETRNTFTAKNTVSPGVTKASFIKSARPPRAAPARSASSNYRSYNQDRADDSFAEFVDELWDTATAQQTAYFDESDDQSALDDNDISAFVRYENTGFEETPGQAAESYSGVLSESVDVLGASSAASLEAPEFTELSPRDSEKSSVGSTTTEASGYSGSYTSGTSSSGAVSQPVAESSSYSGSSSHPGASKSSGLIDDSSGRSGVSSSSHSSDHTSSYSSHGGHSHSSGSGDSWDSLSGHSHSSGSGDSWDASDASDTSDADCDDSDN